MTCDDVRLLPCRIPWCVAYAAPASGYCTVHQWHPTYRPPHLATVPTPYTPGWDVFPDVPTRQPRAASGRPSPATRKRRS